MNKTVKIILSTACVAAAVAGMALLSGCNDSNDPAVITPSDSTPTKATQAVPKGQMTLSDAMAINDDELTWSRLSVFEHTITGEGTATFKVVDTYGEAATLTAEFDEESDAVTKADLTYGDMTATLLTDDNFELLPIMQAMYAEHEAE